jgi:uncharacterized protein with von Willebrand factor type A (vWA) domain
MEEKTVELIISKIDSIGDRLNLTDAKIEAFRAEAKESIDKLKEDMDKRFDSTQRQVQGVNTKIDDEKVINIRQEVKIENLNKDLAGLSRRTDKGMKTLEREVESLKNEDQTTKVRSAKAETKNELVWKFFAIAGGSALTTAIALAITWLLKFGK